MIRLSYSQLTLMFVSVMYFVVGFFTMLSNPQNALLVQEFGMWTHTIPAALIFATPLLAKKQEDWENKV